MDLVDPLRFGAVVHPEQILVNKRTKTIRRAYMVDHAYKIGWVVDWDVSACMVCSQPFGWWLGRPKHHCRACGALVCHACSPYVTTVPGLNEFGGSRVCINCFGLKPGVFGSPSAKASAGMNNPSATTRASEVYKGSPMPSPGNSFSHRHSESAVGDDSSVMSGVRRRGGGGRRQSEGSSGPLVMGMTQEEIDEQLELLEKEQEPFYLTDYL